MNLVLKMAQTSRRFNAGELVEWLDGELAEQEEALERSKAFLEGLTDEEAELAIYGLTQRLRELDHPPAENIVMGWERSVLDGE